MTEPKRFGPYTLVRTLGRGSSAIVVQATDETGAPVALKVPHAAQQSDALDEAFERQVRISHAIGSDHVVRVIGTARQAFSRALVVEFVDGLTLAEVLADGPLPQDAVLTLTSQLAQALVAVHDASEGGRSLGLVHGDVSPSNVLIDTDGRALLTDLGESRRKAMSLLTASSALRGTPGYLAPETARGLAPSRATDMFSLGAVLYEALQGEPAFPGADVFAQARAAVEHLPPPSIELIDAMLHKRPERRLTAHASADRARATDAGIETLAARVRTGSKRHSRR